MQYPHYLCDNIIINHFCICNTFIAYVISLRIVSGVHAIPSSFIIYLNILIVCLVFLCFVSLGANVPHGVAKEGVTWEKDGISLFAN
jgi:hypothetical protein